MIQCIAQNGPGAFLVCRASSVCTLKIETVLRFNFLRFCLGIISFAKAKGAPKIWDIHILHRDILLTVLLIRTISFQVILVY